MPGAKLNFDEMKIAVDTRVLKSSANEKPFSFAVTIFAKLISAHPEHEFILINDSIENAASFRVNKNTDTIRLKPLTQNPVQLRLHYDLRMPSLLKKIKADFFISFTGICPRSVKIPQCLVLHDISLLSCPASMTKAKVFFLRSQMERWLKRTTGVVALSEKIIKHVADNYSADKTNFHIVREFAEDISLPDQPETNDIKSRITSGKNFFYCPHAFNAGKELLLLLKAFSVFKKRQKSDWKLVLQGRHNVSFLKQFATYKYREEVILLTPDEVREELLTAASYAVIFLPECSGRTANVLTAFKCRVPAIVNNGSAFSEIAGNAAIYYEPGDHADLADKMMLVYKDESLRERLNTESGLLSSQFTQERSSEELWKALMKTVDHNAVNPPV